MLLQNAFYDTMSSAYTNSPRLRVDDATHYVAVTMSPGLAVTEHVLYVGGIPAAISLASTTAAPVRNSLIGGVVSLKVNDR